MLQAILNGKAGTLPAPIRPGDSWRQVYKTSEDLLTATVFERLAYLDGPLLWQIFGSTFRPGSLPARQVVELKEILFWPLWQDVDNNLEKAVEPDVVLTFSIGDPPQSVVLIVECKAGGGQQYPDQWAREWVAFDIKCAAAEHPDEVWLLALGGIPMGAAQTVKRFTDEIRNTWGREIRALAADWQDLSRALDEVEIESPIAVRVIQDIKLALELHGYRSVRPMADIVAAASRYATSPGSAAALRTSRLPGAQLAVMAGPTTTAHTFKPMRELQAYASGYRGNPNSPGLVSSFDDMKG